MDARGGVGNPALDDPALRERAMKLGSAFLKKPLGAGALADAIESALAPGEDWGPPQAV